MCGTTFLEASLQASAVVGSDTSHAAIGVTLLLSDLPPCHAPMHCPQLLACGPTLPCCSTCNLSADV